VEDDAAARKLQPLHDHRCTGQRGVAAKRYLDGGREPAQAIVATFRNQKSGLGQVILGGNGLQSQPESCPSASPWPDFLRTRRVVKASSWKSGVCMEERRRFCRVCSHRFRCELASKGSEASVRARSPLLSRCRRKPGRLNTNAVVERACSQRSSIPTALCRAAEWRRRHDAFGRRHGGRGQFRSRREA
jgi:hypothetical protein